PSLEPHRFIWRSADEGLWVLAMDRGVEEVEIVHGVVTRGCSVISLTAGLWIGWSHAVCTTYRGFRRCCLDRPESLALREVDGVSCFEKLIETGLARRKNTDAIAVIGEGPGHVEGSPGCDSIAQVLRQDACEVGIVSGQVAVRPSASVFERLGKVPMVNRTERTYACFQQGISQTTVIIDALLI